MKFFTQSCLLIASFVFLFGSCTVQDHLKPSSIYQNCRLSVQSEYKHALILPDYDLKVGDTYLIGGFVVKEIINVDNQAYALGTDPYNLFYEYDSAGKLLKTEDNNSTGKHTTYYEYWPNQIKLKETFSKGNDKYSMYILNTQELVIKSILGLGRDTSTVLTASYDDSGYRINDLNLPKSSKYLTNYTVLNDNIVKSESAYGDIAIPSEYKYSNEYEYDLSRPNLPNPFPFLGKTSRNLLIKETNTNTSPNTSNTSGFEYNYIFDNDGRVKRRIMKYQPPYKGLISITDYTYSCE